VAGELALPLTTIEESNFQADGTGSRLDLSPVTTCRGVFVSATRGGSVDLSHVSTISTGNNGFSASDGGYMNLASLTSFTGEKTGSSALGASSDGTIDAPALKSLTRVDLHLTGRASLSVDHLTSFKEGNIRVFASGPIRGTLALPSLTTIDETDSPPLLFEANGGTLDLSHVTSWRGAGGSTAITVRAIAGGIVDQSHLATIEGNTTFQAFGVNSQLNLSALTRFNGSDPHGSVLEVAPNGTIRLNPDTTVVSNSTVQLDDDTGVLTAGTLQLTGGGRLIGGIGTVRANVVNDGEVEAIDFFHPLVITGTYTQTGNLNGGGTLTVNGLLTWAGGSMGPGTVNANGGLSLSGDTVKTLDGRTLNDNGSGTWTGTGTLNMGHGAVLNLLGAATLDIQSDQAITNTLGGTATLTNAGLLTKSAGSGTTALQVAFANTGTVEVDSGTLSLTGAFSNFAGSTLTGGTYIIAGTFQFPGANIVTNAATIVLDGPSSQIIDEASGDGLRNFATNAAAGNFTVQNGRNFTTAGDFTNTGNLILGPGSTFRVTGNYLQDPSGTLEVQLGDVPASGQFGQLVVDQQATLDGTLQMDLVNGYAGNPGDTFPIVTFGSRSGDFTNLNLAGGTWNPDDGTVSF
jgi:hypothetical protein